MVLRLVYVKSMKLSNNFAVIAKYHVIGWSWARVMGNRQRRRKVSGENVYKFRAGKALTCQP